ncbi:MAG: sensor histidine kinase, partial [Burkholderiales bacterium]
QQEAPRWRWLPYCVGLIVLLASFMLWQGLGGEAIERAQNETAQALDRTRDVLADRVTGQINLLKRLSQHWSYSDDFSDKRGWDEDGDLVLKHFPNISGLALTDKEFVYRLTSYRGTSPSMSGRRADFDLHRKRTIDAAVASRQVRVSNSVNLVQGGVGFIIVSPMLRGDKFVGLVLAGVRFSELMQSAAGEYPRGYAFSVTEFGHELFRYPAKSENAFSDYVHSTQIELPGTTWNIQAWPSREQVSKIGGSLPELVLLFGVVTAVLAGATLSMAQLSMARNRQLAEFTHELEAEIAERRHAEERVRKLNAELEDRVQERTSELESMNRELEAFSYSVSHDLRAPLASIAGFSKILADSHAETLGEEGMHYVRRIGSNVTRMGRLIDDLLNLGRVNRAGLKLQEVDLSVLAGNIISQLSEHDPSRRVETRIEDGLRVRADSNLIEIAVGNLLSNAWKFTAKQDPAVIEFGRERRDGREVFYVRDNGVGFDMAFAGKLFGVFQRLHSESEYPGSGVGLVTVRRVLARHHGEVWATAQPGEGAVFSFWLPN